MVWNWIYLYRLPENLGTIRIKIPKFHIVTSLRLCSQNFAICGINSLLFITEMESVYSAVRTGSLNRAVCASSLNG